MWSGETVGGSTQKLLWHSNFTGVRHIELDVDDRIDERFTHQRWDGTLLVLSHLSIRAWYRAPRRITLLVYMPVGKLEACPTTPGCALGVLFFLCIFFLVFFSKSMGQKHTTSHPDGSTSFRFLFKSPDLLPEHVSRPTGRVRKKQQSTVEGIERNPKMHGTNQRRRGTCM